MCLTQGNMAYRAGRNVVRQVPESPLDSSALPSERAQHRCRTDRQVAQTYPDGREDGVADGRTDDGRRRFAKAKVPVGGT